MKIIKPSTVPAEPATSPLFTGEVSRQPILTPEMSEHFNLGIVNFPAGVRNKMHTHSSDQVLFVTAGTGIIATETEEKEITVGEQKFSSADHVPILIYPNPLNQTRYMVLNSGFTFREADFYSSNARIPTSPTLP